MRKSLAFLITAYQKTVSPDHGLLRFMYPYGFCRHTPTCSEYAKEMVLSRGVVRGVLLGMKRIARCNPWTRLYDEKMVKIIEGQ